MMKSEIFWQGQYGEKTVRLVVKSDNSLVVEYRTVDAMGSECWYLDEELTEYVDDADSIAAIAIVSSVRDDGT